MDPPAADPRLHRQPLCCHSRQPIALGVDLPNELAVGCLGIFDAENALGVVEQRG